MILAEVAAHPEVRHVVLMCPAVNMIDASALESLEAIVARLDSAGVGFHLSEVKGPVMDRLRASDFLDHFGGQVFISQFEALAALDPQTTRQAMAQRRNGHAPQPAAPSPHKDNHREKRP